jgi:hypothetical protein
VFISITDTSQWPDRLDPAFYSPTAIAAENWITTCYQANCLPLSDVAEVSASAFYEGLVERYSQSGVPFIRVADVQNGIVERRGLIYLPDSVAESTDGLTTVSGPLLVITKGGSVGNVGVFPQDTLVSLSRDVVGIRPHDDTQLPVMLFFMASSVGRALLLRGASRQVQAHLTVERLSVFPIPQLPNSEKATLKRAYQLLLNARQVYNTARAEFDAATSYDDPFVAFSKRHLSYIHEGPSSLRERMDPEHHRPSHKEAQAAAIDDSWIRVSEIGRIGSPKFVWGRESVAPETRIRYIPLNSVERGSGRVIRPLHLRAWQVPSRGKWVCKTGVVLAPSLVESLDRVALLDDADTASIASSGFHVIEVADAPLEAYVAAYLLSAGAHEQILRTGSGVRYRSYAATQLRQLLLPPLSRSSQIVEQYWRLRRAATNLHSAWHAGISTLETMLEMPPAIEDLPLSDDQEPPA